MNFVPGLSLLLPREMSYEGTVRCSASRDDEEDDGAILGYRPQWKEGGEWGNGFENLILVKPRARSLAHSSSEYRIARHSVDL